MVLRDSCFMVIASKSNFSILIFKLDFLSINCCSEKIPVGVYINTVWQALFTGI